MFKCAAHGVIERGTEASFQLKEDPCEFLEERRPKNWTKRPVGFFIGLYLDKSKEKDEGGSWEDEDENEQVEGDDMHTRYPAHEPSTLLIRTQQ